MRLPLLALALFSLVLLAPFRATAEPYEDGVIAIASGDFEKIAVGTTLLSSSTSPKALSILSALEDGRLKADSRNQLYFSSGPTLVAVDDASGEPTQPLRSIDINNQVRRALAVAVASLRLVAPDDDVRLHAASDIAKRPTPELLIPLRKAVQTEKNEAILEHLELALARLELDSEERPRRLAALRVVKKYADLSFKPELVSFRLGLAPNDKEMKDALSGAEQAIEAKLFLVNAVANTFYGISLGSVLLLAAMGLAITFGLMRVINMAHGEMLMLGAYSTFSVQQLFSAYFPSNMDLYLALAIPVAFLATAVVGMALEMFVVKKLYGRPLETLLSTWGLSLILIQSVRLTFGAQNVTVSNPTWLSGGFELMPNLVLPYSRIAIVGFTLAIVGAIAVLLEKTSFGLQIRAVTQNRSMAASMGIPAPRVDTLTFGLGSGLAGLGGVALSQLGNVGPELGQSYIVDSFMVVVLGGVGKLIGTVLGATGLGLLNKYLEPALGAVLGKIAILVLIIVFLQRRPQGLFALKGRSSEVV